MSDSEGSADENAEQTQKENSNTNKPEENIDRKRLPKHLKKRYWNSWEEMKLVELWRLHFNEIVDLDHNLPIFRTLTAALRESGFHMSAQDVRRRLKIIKNKYIGERRRLSRPKDACKEPEWRLFRLVHSIMEPRQKNPDLSWEQKQLTEINERNRKDPLYQLFLKDVKVTEETLERGETVDVPKSIVNTPTEFNFPIENKMVAAQIHVGYKMTANRRTFTPRVHRHNDEMLAHAKMIEIALKKISSSKDEVIIVQEPSILKPKSQTTSIIQKNSFSSTSFKPQQHIKTQPGILCGQSILKRNATKSALEQIRAENRQSMEKVIVDTKRLRLEEQKLKNYELAIAQVASQYAIICQKLGIDDNFDFRLNTN